MNVGSSLTRGWFRHVPLGATLAAALLCSQCAPLYYGDPRGAWGQTQYLMGFGPPGGQPQNPPRAYRSPPPDTVSWWKGDDVPGNPAIVLSLHEQRAYFYKNNHLVGVSVLSTGDENHPTPTGHFSVMQKDRNHRSSQYGDYVDSEGNIVRPEVDREVDPMPRGTHFLGSEMHNFMRFSSGKGMHTGYLPGYPASHGCVRMPDRMSEAFFRNAEVGTPVEIRP